MPFTRILAYCLAGVLCAAANPSLAEQISGQLHISLTILKRCEIVARSDAASVYLSGHSCEHSAYQVRDDQGRALALSQDGQTASLPVKSIEKDGSTLVVYW
ncbi:MULTISPECIES: hypothetical protein [unclassified Pseudomonas]|uniref:hypothetical protein n=1 Tax=unclassified Pseudomonas TaxID=196821 RepID=UPI000EEB78B0|nr:MULTISPECIES: hypothetical protein [unclassified Pseudomonas]HBZ95173.1 hypothetical protein [Pseudomonas sp.]